MREPESPRDENDTFVVADGSARPRSLLRVSRLLVWRLLAFAAAALFGVAAWMPWFVGTYQAGGFGGSGAAQYFDGSLLSPVVASRFFLSGASDRAGAHLVVGFSVAIVLIWTALTGLGLLLAPLLWQRGGSRSARRAIRLYGAWLLLSTVLAITQAVVLFASLTAALPPAPPAQPGFGVSPFATLTLRVSWGLPLMGVALGLGWCAWLILRQMQRRAAPAIAIPREAPTQSRLVTRSVLTAGILLWIGGFFAIPWATVNCATVPFTFNHFTEGACAGLDSGDALVALVTVHLPRSVWNLTLGGYTLYGVLLGGALFSGIALWRRPRTTAVRAWAAVWLLCATVFAILAYRGIAYIIAQAPLLSSDSRGEWHGATGLPVTFLGLLLSWGGLAALDVAAGSVSATSVAQAEPRAAGG